ncbi:thioredoxin domain-containing protein [Azospirillum sp. RWY-5-1]|uniref:Thioredoxin domain-containing protein n=1 Tax=Azospirillum oleiclasticum TaxID=2735135 RepID=A0ABX2T8U9_9PROT|nr:thioredoxin domain-containing protein [Azospirillum oleiclasticum]NYZ13097.1 thioredoxin domain-containing protein [Azospirillum oleiclasticum]NYZ20230.1 thioredoxin domain-containing protein [Azospirillum oleiclasticum]
MSANLLHRETSPYLLQHKDNPVHWMPWGDEAFERARREGKPILLSVGYAACHWCHVMAHESFENPAIAGLMNELFVNIKVDREERPDVDHIYQSALALLGQPGGWPLTMFLTPGGEPFWGGTYFPPSSRYGRPGFPDVLRGVAETYRADPEKIGRNVTALREALESLAENHAAGAVDVAVLDQVAERLVREVDSFRGGIGSAPKFPQVPIFELFWRAWLRTGRNPFRQAVITTLTHMAQGGIYDHLGGGFARYSVDDEWLAPHFEKMLYDNAQLLELMTTVWQETREPLLEARCRETVGWLLREMIADGGGFASTLDADSEGEEGRFYVWTEAEVDRLLGPDAPLFKRVYDVSAGGNWEHRNILNRLQTLELEDTATEERLAALRAVLLAAREGRVRPGWDDKVLADWNGLMIAALANAGAVFGEDSWITAAQRAFNFVVERMQRDGRLHHAWRDGQLKHLGTLDDLAQMARAGLFLFEATGDAAPLDHARGWVAVLDRHHWDTARGGYFYTADDAANLIVRTKSAHDAAVPAGNGTMVGVLARLHALTGEEAYRERADALIAAFSGELTRNFFPLSTLLNGVELLTRPVQVVIVGDPADPAAADLRRAALGPSVPNRILMRVTPDQALPAGHPAAGKGQREGRPTAYVCVGPTCSPPVTDPADLVAALRGR